MLYHSSELIFFSLNKQHVKIFELYVKSTNVENKKFYEFKLVRDQSKLPLYFDNLRDLFNLLENIEIQNLPRVILVIDLYSIPKSNIVDFENIKELILLYPEVKIVFKTIVNDSQHWTSILDIDIFNQRYVDDKKFLMLPEMHNFYLDKDNFEILISGNHNLFDASNLRNCIKNQFSKKMKMSQNFKNAQNSREKNLSVCIDEEVNQAFFNSYALFVNGYRSLPIISYKAFEKLNLKNDSERINATIIIRDYDLQFEDLNDAPTVNDVRGLVRISLDDGGVSWKINQNIWVENQNIDTFFVTRYEHSKKNETPEVTENFKCNFTKNTILSSKAINIKNGICIIGEKPFLRGISKPVNGFYSFHKLRPIKTVFDNSSDGLKKFNIIRDAGGHSVPPFITHIAESLLERSRIYYNLKMFLFSSLTAREAFEILNGFHLMIMLDCIHMQTIAETSLEISMLGVEDEEIAISAQIRFNDIIKQIRRLTQNNDRAKLNVLSQIFNDVRNLYLQKELFKSADVALNELVNIRHGVKLQFLR